MKDSEDLKKFKSFKAHHTNTLLEAIEKKEVDPFVIPFLLEVIKIEDICTSSSCSGRVALLKTDKNANKKHTNFLKKYHSFLNYEDLKKEIDAFTSGYLWLNLESFIFHFITKDYDKAKEILDFSRDFGLKRAGIISTKEGKFTVEVISTSYFSIPIKINNKLLVDLEYLKIITDLANEKLEENHKKKKILRMVF